MLYHLSKSKNLIKLTPRVPECVVPSYEDSITKRICFSDSIEGCLSAIQEPGEYYVYNIDQKTYENDLYIPSVYDVRDAKYTHEVWILKEVNVKCIGKIKSFNYDSVKYYNSGRGRVAVFHFPYEWITCK